MALTPVTATVLALDKTARDQLMMRLGDCLLDVKGVGVRSAYPEAIARTYYQQVLGENFYEGDISLTTSLSRVDITMRGDALNDDSRGRSVHDIAVTVDADMA